MPLQYFRSLADSTQGIWFMLYACLWFSVMAVLIRYLSDTVPAFQMVFMRNLFSVACILPWAWKFGLKNIRTKRWDLYGVRAVTGVLGMNMLFYAISVVPLSDVIALTFTVPLITAVLAMWMLHEKIDMHRWVALLAGFMGILIIVRPGTEAFHYASLLVLATTCCWSVSNIMVKKLTSTDDPKMIVFIMMIIMTPCSLPLAIMVWQDLNFEQLVWLFILGWVSNQGQYYMTHAFAKADMSVVLPFDFSRLVFISALAYVFFGEIISFWTLIGGVVIFGSAFYVARREAKARLVIDSSNEVV